MVFRGDLRPEVRKGTGLVGRGVHDVEAVRGQAGDGHVGLDAPARVEHLRIDDRAGRYVDPVAAYPVQDLHGVAAL